MNELYTNNSPLEHSRACSLVLAILFPTLLMIPMLWFIFTGTRTISENEQRTLAPKPQLILDSIKNYPKNYEAFFNDQFPFRQHLWVMNSYMKARVMRVSPLPDQVIIGKQGWLFCAACLSDTFSMEYLAGQLPYTSEELSSIRKNLLETKKFLDDKHIGFAVVVAPNKQTIYSEYLPGAYASVRGVSRVDQLYRALSDLPFFPDLRAALLAAKAEWKPLPLYYKTDTHWNDLGAYTVWQQITKCMITSSSQYGEPKVEFLPNSLEGGDLARMMSLRGAYRDAALTVRITAPKQKMHKALVFRDSFFDRLYQYFTTSFDTIIKVDVWDGVNSKIIEEQKPDFVLLEMSERYQAALKVPFH